MLLLARVLLILLLVFIVPVAARAAWWYTRTDLAPSWGRADWSSAGLLPAPSAETRAIVRIYAARTGRWRGIFAHHAWIVVKEPNGRAYVRYDKVGWGSPVRTDGWVADGRWFGNPPETVLALDGEAAERAIPAIRAAVAAYPYRGIGDYRAWPGPNSNTFVAHVVGAVPELSAALPPTALGKDWRPWTDPAGLTLSRTGIRLSLGGLAGFAIGWVEGVEVNLLGLVAGVDLRRPAVKIPGWGRFGMDP